MFSYLKKIFALIKQFFVNNSKSGIDVTTEDGEKFVKKKVNDHKSTAM